VNHPRHEHWSGQLGFILATIGSAVGIGSIWKFPYEVGANGGAGFVLFYVLGIVLIVMPLMLAEFAIGRRGGGDPVASITAIAQRFGRSRGWSLAGGLGVFTGFLILSYYSVIGGWTLGYAIDSIRLGLPGTDPRAVQTRYDTFLAAPGAMLAYHAVFIAMAGIVVARGITGGIETASKILTPALIVLMVALAAYSVSVGDVAATTRFLFKFEPASLTPKAALEALGLGFFSIGVGLGLMITYAAYSGRNISLMRVAGVSVVADTAISILAGFAVFPIVFGHGLDPASGPGLVFVTIPLAFADLPFGQIGAIAFFALLFIAALASAISMLELVVALLAHRMAGQRRRAALIASTACFIAGIPTVLSFNLWANWYPLAGLGGFATATFFDLLDGLTSNVLLPLGGFALALFAGWAIPNRLLQEELRLGATWTRVLHGLLRYIAPLGIAAAALAAVIL
jgi:neurotransmitter:Na+ symporter, NSS family